MALSQSVLSELLDAFRAGDGVDLIRDAVRLVLQELIEVEATERDRRRPLRTHRHPRHRTQRSPAAAVGHPGRRHRAADPEAAQGLVLPAHPGAAPPDRPGPVRGGDGGLRRTACRPAPSTTWSTALGVDSGISKSEVSRICAGLDEIVGAFRTRRLGSHRVPLRLPRRHLPPRPQHQPRQVASMAVVVATGITADGDREVLGVDIGDSEDEAFWRGFLRSLQAAAAWAGCAW